MIVNRLGSNESRQHLGQNLSNKAIPLLLVDDNGGMKVSDIAEKLLSKRTSNKVAVVSIFGECASGKSYLLN